MNDDDEFICAELGLDVPDGRAGEQFLGLVTMTDGSWIEVTVHNKGVRHWTFLIYSNDEDQVVTLECGSGTLDVYWPFAQQVAEGMVRVVSVIEKLSEEVQAAQDAEPLAPDERLRLYLALARKFHQLGQSELRRSAMSMAREARRELIRETAVAFIDELRAADEDRPSAE